VASGGLFFAMEGSSPRRKIAPAFAVPAAMLGGGLTGLQIVAAAAPIAALLPRRVPARLLGFGGLLAGLLLLGPPRPAEPEPFRPEHMAGRYPRYDWHDPVAVDMGCPSVELIPPGDPSSPLLVVTQADLPDDGGVTAWMSLGDTLVAVGPGRGRFELPLGAEPLRLSLDGDWHPFERVRVTVTTLEEMVP